MYVYARDCLQVINRDAAPTQQLAVQLNKSAFGILPTQQQIAFDHLLVQGARLPLAGAGLGAKSTPALLCWLRADTKLPSVDAQ